MMDIEDRITELTALLSAEISKLGSYSSLSGKEKIPLRIMAAEIVALRDFLKGRDLDADLSILVDYEHYCGAEGIKRAKEWINKHPHFTNLQKA